MKVPRKAGLRQRKMLREVNKHFTRNGHAGQRLITISTVESLRPLIGTLGRGAETEHIDGFGGQAP